MNLGKSIAIIPIILVALLVVISNQQPDLLNAQDQLSGSDHTGHTELTFHQKQEKKHGLTSSSNKAQEKEILTEEIITSVTSKFMDQLVQKSNQESRVMAYDSKKELIKSFSSIANKSVAKEYVDFYYKEYNNGLYILPTDTPPWFQENESYTTETLEDGRIAVTQHNTSELYGKYTVSFVFTHTNEGWIIDGISHS
ncbi:hypothetical protein N780_10000 [Pontibacillus chungwhensis BH030062]|uniref:DUF3993 domain-containing protein n=1 Tax=Pontibacillus chungwhensis BH030062 TaxID=1385513 RepID=A0A0A2UTH8_9BACI|nr:hypothetical protein [Pontibacillus chungwhensis]KGP89781.1 hypothetical protein N780_10000 [Pontibacillus chungwhensis BH030062]